MRPSFCKSVHFSEYHIFQNITKLTEDGVFEMKPTSEISNEKQCKELALFAWSTVEMIIMFFDA